MRRGVKQGILVTLCSDASALGESFWKSLSSPRWQHWICHAGIESTPSSEFASQRVAPSPLCDRALNYRALTHGSSLNQALLDAFECGAAWAAIYDPSAMPFDAQQLEALMTLGWQADCVIQANTSGQLGLLIVRNTTPNFCSEARWPGKIPAEQLVECATRLGWSVYQLPVAPDS